MVPRNHRLRTEQAFVSQSLVPALTDPGSYSVNGGRTAKQMLKDLGGCNLGPNWIPTSSWLQNINATLHLRFLGLLSDGSDYWPAIMLVSAAH